MLKAIQDRPLINFEGQKIKFLDRPIEEELLDEPLVEYPDDSTD